MKLMFAGLSPQDPGGRDEKYGPRESEQETFHEEAFDLACLYSVWTARTGHSVGRMSQSPSWLASNPPRRRR